MPFPVIDKAKTEAITEAGIIAEASNTALGSAIRAELLAAVTSINGILASIQGTLDTHTSQLATHTGQIAAIVLDVAAIDVRVTTLESYVPLTAYLAYVNPILQSLQDQITALTP